MENEIALLVGVGFSKALLSHLTLLISKQKDTFFKSYHHCKVLAKGTDLGFLLHYLKNIKEVNLSLFKQVAQTTGVKSQRFRGVTLVLCRRVVFTHHCDTSTELFQQIVSS